MIDGLKPYAEYKESNIPWMPSMPLGWNTERAKWLFTKMNRPVRSDDEVVTCFRDGMVTLRKNRRLRGFTEAVVEAGYQGIRKGDLVIHAMDAFAGAVGVSDSDGKGTPVYSVCQAKREANSHYYALAVRQMAQAQWILAIAKGIRERSTDFRFETFGNQRVPLPPPDEQVAIVRFLEHANRKIDGFIRAKRKLIGLLNEQKQAIIHRAVTRGLNPDAPLKPSGIPWLGDIPEHWEVRQLRRVCKRIKTGGTPKEVDEKFFEAGGFNWHTPSDFRDAIELGAASRQLSKLGLAEVTVFPANTILMIGIGATIGKVSISRLPCSCNQQINAILPKQKLIHVDFLAYYLRTLRKYIVDCGKFTTMPIINQDETKRLPILIPPNFEQEKIASYVEQASKPFNAAIVRTKREITLMHEYQTRLTVDVVTGKLDVRAAAAKLPGILLATDPTDDDTMEEPEAEDAK
ncbi:restriction endonuclease subunit S [Spartobacteria bacterium LR76]|nr:restriction endonuclease subunit S [Spartobacteria bacterium LR76]